MPLVHHKPHVVFLAMHTEQMPLANTYYFAPLYTLLVITRNLSTASYIADLIVYLRNTSCQIIKKQGDFVEFFAKIHLMKQEIGLTAICHIKLITNNYYSPTNKNLFCLLNLLNLWFERQMGKLTSEDKIRTLLYHSLYCPYRFHVACLWSILRRMM